MSRYNNYNYHYERGNYGYDNNPYGYYDRQYKQSTVSKQEIAQIQDLELSNDTMCRVLTLGEKYALGQNVNFGAYNMSSAVGDDLLRLFVREIEIFRLSYQDYVEEHGDYKFPKNLSKSRILSEIKLWGECVGDEAKRFYNNLADIINGNYDFSLKDDIKALKAKKKKIDYKDGEKARNLMMHVPTVSHNTKNLARQAEENYLKDKNYRTEAKLGKKPNQKDLDQLSKDAHYDDDMDLDDPK